MGGRRHHLLLGILLMGQLVFLSLQVRDDGAGGAAGDPLFGFLTPLAGIVTAPVDGVRAAWTGYLDLRDARRESFELERRVHEMQMRLDRLAETQRENDRLRRLLRMRDDHGWGRTVGANVLTMTRTPTASTLLLDRGTRHGLRVDLPVLAPEGVVGRIVSVGPATARVQLLTDPAAAVAVVFERSREHASGIAAGGRGRRLEVRYVSHLADVQPGDLVRTSGLGGIYPEGLPVGTVGSVRDQADLLKEVELVPVVPMGRLEEVLVLLEGHEAGTPHPEPPAEPLEEAEGGEVLARR